MQDKNNQQTTAARYDKLFKALFIAILAIGLFMRFYQYLMGRSLWEDETHFALNFINYGYYRLSQPLDYIQAAPIFFIYATKTFCLLLGYTEIAFRATPFIFSILTLPLCYYIMRQLSGKKTVALFGFFFFAVNVTLVYFSSELKPYAVDVAVYLLLTYITIGNTEYLKRNRHLLLAIAGCLAILFSNVSFILMICIGCYMLRNWWYANRIDRKDILVLLSWAAVFVPNYFMFIYHHPATADQKLNYSFAFCPENIFSHEFWNFIETRAGEIFLAKEWTSKNPPSLLLWIYKNHGFPYIIGLVFAMGTVYMILKKQYTALMFTWLPILLHLVLSQMKLYPFWFRLILYLVPAFIYILSLGVIVIAEFLAKRVHLVAGLVFSLICCFLFVYKSLAKFPMWPLEIKPAINFVNKRAPHAHVYITTPVNAYRYYTFRGYAKNNIYKELPWTITPNEIYEFVSEEKSEFVIFYGASYREWGYKDAIDDIKKRNLVIDSFEYTDYAVAIVKPRKPDIVVKNIDPGYFDSTKWLKEGADKVLAFWGNDSVVSVPVKLASGKYTMRMISYGSQAGGIYSHANVYMDRQKLGDFNATQKPGWFEFPITVYAAPFVISIKVDNDAIIDGNDRNMFIKNIAILRTMQ